MKIGINIHGMNRLNKGRGVGFYTENLIKSLKKYSNQEVEVIDTEGAINVDVMHYPFFDFFRPTLPINKRFPTVVTIHDVTPLVFPEHYPPGIKGKLNFFNQKFALRNIKAIITDSENSKNDICKYLNIKSSNIFPIYLAPDDSFKLMMDKNKLEKVRNKYNLPKKFMLFVGDVNWNKNLINLTQACLDANTDICFVGKSFTNSPTLEHPELKSFKLFKQQFLNNPLVYILGFIEQNELVYIYNLAKGLLLPSFYEGFGLPILEAQACGVPVITGNISSMPEVAGKGAIFVNPKDIKEITNAIKNLLEDESLRRKLIKNGFENIKRFSWEKVAKDTLAVYEKVIN